VASSRGPGQAVALLVGVLVGAGTGLVTTFQSRAYVRVAALDLPVGLPAAVLLSALVVAVGGLLGGSRRWAVAVALGWFAAVVVFAGGRPEGDVVVAGDTLGLAWLGLGSLAVGGAAALPYASLRRRALGGPRTEPLPSGLDPVRR
jgi:hypothetical protein